MARKKKTDNEVKIDPFLHETDDRIVEKSVDEILGDCFGRYSKEVIQNRALPDGADGLKPVQRRILYAMYTGGNTYNKPYHKSAKTIGQVLALYHPHGDSSVYDAMCRLSQSWKIPTPLIDMQGNNGSIDGDSPAAMRYCVTGDTRVLTSEGLIPIASIVPDTELNSDNEIDVKVMSYKGNVQCASKLFNSGVHDTYRVTLKNGSSITGTSNHPLMVITDNFELKWKTISELEVGDKCVLPKTKSRLFGMNDDLLEARMLGVMVSEGYVTTQNRIGVNNTDHDLVKVVKEYFDREIPKNKANIQSVKGAGYFEYTISAKDFYNKFIDKYEYANKAEDKKVPECVFRGTREYQREFLRYLFEGDGSVSNSIEPTVKYDCVQISYSTHSEVLAKQVQLLLQNFGVISNVYYHAKHSEYKVCIQNRTEIFKYRGNIGFVSERKNGVLATIQKTGIVANNGIEIYPEMSNYLQSRNKGIKRVINTKDKLEKYATYITKESYAHCYDMITEYVFMPITAIEEAGKQTVYSIRVDSDDHSFIANGFINHNTEARLSHLADYMLKDIDKDTVEWVPNFSDEELEPTVLPLRYPNLLINGISGIASGYATNIPPHNLTELMQAVIHRVKNPDSTLDDLMRYVKGPDFPTGGIVMGIDGIKTALRTGKGKVIVRGKTEVTKTQIIITEIPYEVVKCDLVKQIDNLRIDKKLGGVTEVRDESGRNGLRIVLDLKKDAPVDSILNYLYKNTDLQVNINYNMTAIVDKVPKVVSLVKALDVFINHRVSVITRRSLYDRKKKMERQHILEGLIRAMGILDEVIQTIRSSKNKADARNNLINQYGFSEKQAEAIVVMQLYKLTNTDVDELIEENKQLTEDIAELTKILEDENELKNVIIAESEEIMKEFPTPRKSVIEGDIQEIVIDEQALIPSENVQVSLTRDGYIKRVSNRSYLASGEVIARHKDGDVVVAQGEVNTRDVLLFFTDKGNYGAIPVYKIHDFKWKDLGDHIDTYVKIGKDETIIGGVAVSDFNTGQTIVMMTANGRIKQVNVSDFKVSRSAKVSKGMPVSKGDRLGYVRLADNAEGTVYITTKYGRGNSYSLADRQPVSTIHSGVGGIKLADGDCVVGIEVNPKESITLISEFGEVKKCLLDAYAKQSRMGSGRQILKKGLEVAYTVADEDVYLSGSMDTRLQQEELSVTGATAGFTKEMKADSQPVEILNYIR